MGFIWNVSTMLVQVIKLHPSQNQLKQNKEPPPKNLKLCENKWLRWAEIWFTACYIITVLKGLSAEENATLLERTAPHITVPSHIVWGQEDQVRFNIIA